MIADDLSRIAMSSGLAASLSRATEHARARAHIEVTLEHMLLALCDDQDAALVLAASNVNVAELVREVEGQLSVIAPHPQGQHGELLVAPDLRRILEAAAAAARGGRRREINGAIVLAAIVGDGKSVAAHVLGELGMTFEGAIRALQAKPAEPPPRSTPAPDAEAILANARERVQSRTAPPPGRRAHDQVAGPNPQLADPNDGSEPTQPGHYPGDDSSTDGFDAEADAGAAAEGFDASPQTQEPAQYEPDFEPSEVEGSEYEEPAYREGGAEQRHEPSDYRATLPPILGQRERAPYGPDYEPDPEPQPEAEPEPVPAPEFEQQPEAPPPAFRRATPTASRYRPEPPRQDYGHGGAPADSYGAEPVEPAFDGDDTGTYGEPNYAEPEVADYAPPESYGDELEPRGGPPPMPASAPFPPPLPPPSAHDGWAPSMPQSPRPEPRVAAQAR
ncbi:MAG TPA: Clp protease N-terminal domain-containing protein, partial [Hyphomicrobium sp.]|nr:Clp protease N-terminal domain-containing protein [Hyphomicrobium sp.]